MTRINIIIAMAVAALTISIWAFVNQPETEPPWPAVIQGFAFSPMRADQDPMLKKLPSVEELDEVEQHVLALVAHRRPRRGMLLGLPRGGDLGSDPRQGRALLGRGAPAVEALDQPPGDGLPHARQRP